MSGGRPVYDAVSDRFWDGDTPLPRNHEEAREWGLYFDPATDAYWNGETMVCKTEVIDRYTKLSRDGFSEIR